jgi:ABC-type glycerol-3-phosphate transport system permease component
VHPIRAFRAAVLNVSASGASLIALVPFYLVFVNALKTQPEASSMGVELPLNPQWANFGTVVDQGKLVTAFLNSVVYSLGGRRSPSWSPRSPHMCSRGIGPAGTRSSTSC